jgi:uncharacterized protein (DUF58 family)
VPTREGTVLLIVAGATFLLATNLMSGLLFVLNALLVALLLVGVLTAVRPLAGITAARRAPARGVEGRPVPVELTLSAARAARFLVVEDGFERARVRGFVAAVHPGRAQTVALAPVPPRRGRCALGPAEVVSRGLVGLIRARRRIAAPAHVLVWPRVAPVPNVARAHLAPVLDGAAAVRTREPLELYGVRDYRAGDSLAHVHWKTSARRGALVVREFERPHDSRVAVVIDLDRRQSAARLDAAARAAASLLWAAHEARVDATLAAWNGGLVERAGWEAAMDWLATAVPSGPPVGRVLEAIRERTGRSLIVVASSSAVPAAPGVVAVVPAEEAGAGHGLVYTAEGVVQAC